MSRMDRSIELHRETVTPLAGQRIIRMIMVGDVRGRECLRIVLSRNDNVVAVVTADEADQLIAMMCG